MFSLQHYRIIASKALAVLGLSLTACAAQAAVAPTLGLGGSLDYGYDSNIGNAPDGSQRVESGFAEANVHLNFSLPLSDYFSLLARASVQGQAPERVDGLTNVKAAGLLRAYFRPGLGLFVPTFSLWGSLARWDFNSRMRDSDEYRGGLILQQQLTTQINLRAAASLANRVSSSDVFDQHTRSGSLDFEWQPAQAWRLSLGAQYIGGDTTATAAPSFNVIRAADMVEPDDAFGGIAANQYAYRIKAHTRVGTFGVNYALSGALSLDLQALYAESRSDSWDARYRRWIGNAGLLWKFGQ